MPQYTPKKFVLVTQVPDPDTGQTVWLGYIYMPSEWEKLQSQGEDSKAAQYIDCMGAMDEVSLLSRIKKEYVDFGIGETEGEIKEWR